MAALRLVLLLLLVLPAGLAARDRPDEYDVKAVYLLKFGLFVRWPESAFADSTDPLVIGVVGRDPFGPRLGRALEGRTLAGRPLALKRFATAAELDSCHILFVAEHEDSRMREVLRKVRGQATLTVGEAEDFLESGGALQFVVRDGRVRFRVDSARARLAGLDISSKLLQLSD